MFTAIRLFMSSVWSFLLPSLRIYLTQTGVIMAASAVKAVKKAYLMGEEVSGTDKRKAAYEIVVQDLKEQNILDVTKNKIYQAVVTAYETEYGDKSEK